MSIVGEESSFTLHHSSPLFTLTFLSAKSFQEQRLVFNDDQLQASMMAGLTAIR